MKNINNKWLLYNIQNHIIMIKNYFNLFYKENIKMLKLYQNKIKY
jgi:hypothetical protein